MVKYKVLEMYKLETPLACDTQLKWFDLRKGKESSNSSWIYSIYFHPEYVSNRERNCWTCRTVKIKVGRKLTEEEVDKIRWHLSKTWKESRG